MDLHVYLHFPDGFPLGSKLLEQGKQIMAKVEDVIALETANKQLFTDYIAKVEAHIADLLAQIKALTGTTGVATQAQIDALFALAEAERVTFTPVVVPPPDPNPVPPPEPVQPV